MKIKTKVLPFEQVAALPKPKRKRPKRPWFLFRVLIRVLGIPELWKTRFSHRVVRENTDKGPCLILMNHSAFIDLKIASRLFFPKPYNIVCTSDGFVGKEWLMRQIGCIPTQKFVTDLALVSDILYALHKNKTSVLMYPEASYSFDGCATPLPRHLGKLIKKAGVPVVTVITEGAFLHDPLYNGLRQRKVKVSAKVNCLLTLDEVAAKSAEEIDALLDDAFSFDNFAKQKQTDTHITEPFRAKGLERVLYRCPACSAEGKTVGEGSLLTCRQCGKQYELTTLGEMKALAGGTEFSHIPDWYAWERECVKRELTTGEYRLDVPVKIGVLADFKAIYMVGDGRLVHDENGFSLTGCDGKLCYTQPAGKSYGLYADYFWYEIGDVICIGNKEQLYYCFPQGDVCVAKARLAAEEQYKLQKNDKSS
ncbi:MAG: 1-acyl-sn-glycerol-3-phosphate acyltransferase [Clostridia bacterium]|nr:1-acyl-sn-glycerol-3-phosphate acyltransferase [Clostridia bacterium]